MPKYYCDYCDTYLTHDSPSVRKTHCQGRKHKDNVKFYYQKWMEDQAQQLIDATTAMYKAGKISSMPFGGKGAAIPPPSMLMPPNCIPPNAMPPNCMPPMPGVPQAMMVPPPTGGPPVMPPPGVPPMLIPPGPPRPGMPPSLMMPLPPQIGQIRPPV